MKELMPPAMQDGLAGSMKREQEAQGLLGPAEAAAVQAQEQLESLQEPMQHALADCRSASSCLCRVSNASILIHKKLGMIVEGCSKCLRSG